MSSLSDLVYALVDRNPEAELSRVGAAFVTPNKGTAVFDVWYKGSRFQINIEDVTMKRRDEELSE